MLREKVTPSVKMGFLIILYKKDLLFFIEQGYELEIQEFCCVLIKFLYI